MLPLYALAMAGTTCALPNLHQRQHWEPTEVPIPNKCSVEDDFRDEIIGASASEARFFWNQAIAVEKYFNDWIDDNGKDNWAGRLLGSTVSCHSSFPDTSKCGLPSKGSCEVYESPEVYYIHVAVANFASIFGKWHEELQTKAITSLGSEIDEIVEYWGKTGFDASQLLGLIGGAIGAAGGFIAGPLAPIFGAASFLVGTATSAAGDDLEGTTIEDLNGDIRSSFTTMFTSLDEALTDTVKGLLTGAGDIDIVETLGDGKFISEPVVDSMAEEWIEGSKKMMIQSVLINIWQTQTRAAGQRPDDPMYLLHREVCALEPGRL